jgi:hypothetical protein
VGSAPLVRVLREGAVDRAALREVLGDLLEPDPVREGAGQQAAGSGRSPEEDARQQAAGSSRSPEEAESTA